MRDDPVFGQDLLWTADFIDVAFEEVIAVAFGRATADTGRTASSFTAKATSLVPTSAPLT